MVVADSPLVKAVKILLNVKNIDTGIFSKYPFVTAAGLYGSCARGENTENSDVDLWLRVKDVEETKIASLTSEINRKIKNAKILLLSDKRLEKNQERRHDVLSLSYLWINNFVWGRGCRSDLRTA